jgi:hypothetical protein
MGVRSWRRGRRWGTGVAADGWKVRGGLRTGRGHSREVGRDERYSGQEAGAAECGHGQGTERDGCAEKKDSGGQAWQRTGGRHEASYARRGDAAAKEDETGVPRRGEDAVARRNGMGLRADTGRGWRAQVLARWVT